MERKIIKIGNSFGITLPKKILDELEWREGKELKIENREGQIVLKETKKVNLPDGVSREVFEEILKEYKKREEG